jgi:hypothetical protein
MTAPAAGRTPRSLLADSSKLDRNQRSGICLFFLGASPCPEAARKAHMPSIPSEFSEVTLTELLRALRARTSRHPDNPGLIASWPGVREDRMAAACAELLSRGHPVFRVSIPSAIPGKKTRDGWAVRATLEERA